MKLHQLIVCAGLAGVAFAQTEPAGPKIALVNMQDAIVGTTDGKNAEKQLDAEFEPRKATLDVQEKEIARLQSQLEKGGISDQAKTRLGQQIDEKTMLFNQATQEADAALQAAQLRVIRDLAPKMIACITAYSKSKGYAMVFDISESDVPKLYGNAVDITKEVIAEYEKTSNR